MTQKIDKIKVISKVVLECDVEFGHLKWSIVQISKRSGVSRVLIYRYLGKSKLEILENALRVMFDSLFRIEDFQEINTSDLELVSNLRKSLKGNLRHIRSSPNISAFTTLHYAEESVIGDLLRKREQFYTETHVRKKYNLNSKLQCQLFRIMSHGLINGHFLDLEDQDALADFFGSTKFLDWLRSVE